MSLETTEGEPRRRVHGESRIGLEWLMREALSLHLGDGVSRAENPSWALNFHGEREDQLKTEASQAGNEGWGSSMQKELRVSPGCKGETHQAIKDRTPHTAWVSRGGGSSTVYQKHNSHPAQVDGGHQGFEPRRVTEAVGLEGQCRGGGRGLDLLRYCALSQLNHHQY